MTRYPSNNLAPESQPWARDVEIGLDENALKSASVKERILLDNRSVSSTLDALTGQTKDLTTSVNDQWYTSNIWLTTDAPADFTTTWTPILTGTLPAIGGYARAVLAIDFSGYVFCTTTQGWIQGRVRYGTVAAPSLFVTPDWGSSSTPPIRDLGLFYNSYGELTPAIASPTSPISVSLEVRSDRAYPDPTGFNNFAQLDVFAYYFKG